MNWREHIWIDAERMHGIPCLQHVRVTSPFRQP